MKLWCGFDVGLSRYNRFFLDNDLPTVVKGLNTLCLSVLFTEFNLRINCFPWQSPIPKLNQQICNEKRYLSSKQQYERCLQFIPFPLDNKIGKFCQYHQQISRKDMDYFKSLNYVRMNFWRVLDDSGNDSCQQLKSKPDCNHKSCDIMNFLYLWSPWTVQKCIIFKCRYCCSKRKPDYQKSHKGMHVKRVPLPSEGSNDYSNIYQKKPGDNQRSPMEIFPSNIGDDSGYCWGTNRCRLNWISSHWVQI